MDWWITTLMGYDSPTTDTNLVSCGAEWPESIRVFILWKKTFNVFIFFISAENSFWRF